jgi:nicotinate-nucleotide--dimethylbenzimidazole phosphoribosyltransferase
VAEQDLAPSLDEIRALLREFPGPDLEAGTAAAQHQAQLTKPAGSLGRLEELVQWLATWQGRHPPQVEHLHTAVFAGNHGVADQGVSAYPQAVTQQMVLNFIDGGAAINQLCGLVDADLRVYELALDEPTRDFTQAPAMDELGEMGIANTTSAAALCLGLFGGEAGDWVGRGTGIDDAALQCKTDAVARGVALHRDRLGDPFEVLRCLGGLELAAIVGAVMAARMARIPVVLDGFTCTAAAAVLHAADLHALDHCVVAHLSAEAGHRRLAAQLDKEPLLDLGMRLGEASGAAVAMLILKAASACHDGMATFAGAGVSGPA